jgi:hypothetical protein
MDSQENSNGTETVVITPAEVGDMRSLLGSVQTMPQAPEEPAVEVSMPMTQYEELTPEDKAGMAEHGRWLGQDSLEVALRRASGNENNEAFIRMCFRCASEEESARSAGTYRTLAELSAQAAADAENNTPNE